MPARNTPSPARICRPSRARVPAPLRAARSAGRPRSRTATAPGAPNRNVRPGAKMPPNASPKTQTSSPQPALASPASRDGQPGGAAISQAPMPELNPDRGRAGLNRMVRPRGSGPVDHVLHPGRRACRGWLDDVAEAGPRPWRAEPAASRQRSTGCRSRSAAAAPGRPRLHRATAADWQPRLAARHPLAHAYPGQRRARRAAPRRSGPGASAQHLKAATSVGLVLLRPEFMPGMARASYVRIASGHVSAGQPRRGRVHGERRDCLVHRAVDRCPLGVQLAAAPGSAPPVAWLLACGVVAASRLATSVCDLLGVRGSPVHQAGHGRDAARSWSATRAPGSSPGRRSARCWRARSSQRPAGRR